ncbi:FAX5 [Scenedesmus sp. PABB004]|nr:FAX5 [Scenedesmus sp. PABB004]
MYDFCFTPLYAGALAVGGVAGWVAKGSAPSLAAGLGSAALLAACSQASLRSYRAGTTCKPATALSLAVAAALTSVMGLRYVATGKFMPAGLTAGLSAAMSAFYVWSLLLGPVPKPKAS